mgnify:CR=1 FL=1
MKTLYLIRHAKSSWKDPDLSDHDRLLNKRGKRDAPEMGRRLLKRQTIPDTMISSTANRAYTTAQIIAKEIDFPVDEIIPSSDLFHADPNEILDTVHRISDAHQSAMIFGHNPGFTWAANKLANLQIDSIVAISFSVDSWSDVGFGKGKLAFYDYPKNLN